MSGYIRLCPRKTKSDPKAASYQTVSQPRKGRFQPLRTRPQRTACRRPEWRQRSEMSGNERDTRNFRTQPPLPHRREPAQPPEMSGYARNKQNRAPGPLQKDKPMTFSRLRREVGSLLRKYAKELRVDHLRPLTDEYCDQWEESFAQDETSPMPSGLFEKLPGKSTLRQYFPAVFNYLNDCRWSPCLPHPNRILALPSPRPRLTTWCPGPNDSQPEATPF